MKAHLIDTHPLVPRSRSAAKVKVKYQGHVSQKMGVSGALVFHKHILFFFVKFSVKVLAALLSHTVRDTSRSFFPRVIKTRDCVVNPLLILTYLQQTAFENIVRKEEIARNEQFLLFPQCFLLNQITVSPFVHIFDITSFFAAELEEPTICM